jgi:hypothetical protein
MDIRNEQTRPRRRNRRRLAGALRIALAAAAIAVSLGSQQLPALAFNPQPDPPGKCAAGACGGPTQ